MEPAPQCVDGLDSLFLHSRQPRLQVLEKAAFAEAQALQDLVSLFRILSKQYRYGKPPTSRYDIHMN